MIDVAYIEELRALDLKEGKQGLVDYAKDFNIVVKKNQSFDKMVDDIKAQLSAMADEPMPEDNEGLSIMDMIEAEGSAEKVIDDAKGELLIDSPVVEQIEVVEQFVEQVTPLVADIKIVDVVKNEDAPQIELAVEVKPLPVIENVQLTVVPDVTTTSPDMFELPVNYSPSLNLMGSGDKAYATLPWWIYEWITQNPNWKSNPNSFPHYHGIDTLYSLIYYINRNGSIRIRETRNSSFATLQ